MARSDLEAVAGTGTTLSGLIKGVTRNFQVLKISGDKAELEIHVPTSGNFKDTVKVSDIVLPGDPEPDSVPKDSRWYDQQAQKNLAAQGEDAGRIQSQTAPSKAEADSASKSSRSQGGSKSSSSTSQGDSSPSSSSGSTSS